MRRKLVHDALLKVKMGHIKTKFLLKHLESKAKRGQKWQKVHTSLHVGLVLEMAREEKKAEKKMQEKWQAHGQKAGDVGKEDTSEALCPPQNSALV